MKTELKESEKLELKKSTSELKEGVISIVAILNKHLGGDLYCPSGLMPQGLPSGIKRVKFNRVNGGGAKL